MRHGIFPYRRDKSARSSFLFHDRLNRLRAVCCVGSVGRNVKTVARIKIRTYTAIMPPTMNAIAFQTLFARLFLIASCSLIRESCSANASGCSSASILEPSSRLTGTCKISASFISSSASGTERPFSHFETVCLTTFSLAALFHTKTTLLMHGSVKIK